MHSLDLHFSRWNFSPFLQSSPRTLPINIAFGFEAALHHIRVEREMIDLRSHGSLVRSRWHCISANHHRVADCWLCCFCERLCKSSSRFPFAHFSHSSSWIWFMNIIFMISSEFLFSHHSERSRITVKLCEKCVKKSLISWRNLTVNLTFPEIVSFTHCSSHSRLLKALTEQFTKLLSYHSHSAIIKSLKLICNDAGNCTRKSHNVTLDNARMMLNISFKLLETITSDDLEMKKSIRNCLKFFTLMQSFFPCTERERERLQLCQFGLEPKGMRLTFLQSSVSLPSPLHRNSDELISCCKADVSFNWEPQNLKKEREESRRGEPGDWWNSK